MSDEGTAQPATAALAVLGGPREGAARMSDREDSAADQDGLLSRLKLIEDQPLDARAEAYAHVHDELRDALDAADRRRASDQQGAADRQGGR